MAYEDLIKHLRCPADRGELEAHEQAVLVCKKCGKAYPVRDGVPVMLIDEQVQQEGAQALEAIKAQAPPTEPAEPTELAEDEE